MVSKNLLSILFASLTFTSLQAQEPSSESGSDANLRWQSSGTGKISDYATIEIPEGYHFLNGADTAKFMIEIGNLPATYHGMIGPEDGNWFVVFQYEDTGYVKDDEKDDLDADEILEAMKESDKPANEARRKRGLDTLTTKGWAVEPKYNEETNNLEWGLILQSSDGSENVNYLTKLLGRHGTMHTTLVCDTEELQAILPTYQKVLAGYSYNPGKTYAEFRDGDKVAEYGLKGLIAGGAIFAAAKLGLFGTIALWFKKALKLIVLGAIAIGVWIKRIVTGRKANA